MPNPSPSAAPSHAIAPASTANPTRRPLIAGNWKMHTTLAEATALADAVAVRTGALAGIGAVDVVVAPPFTALALVANTIARTHVRTAAQDMHWADEGAHTGEVSPRMVKELAGYVILGHSERRLRSSETDAEVHRKVLAAFRHGLTPIACVGETEAQRDNNATDGVVEMQLVAVMEDLSPEQVATLVVAYEPVWAIGTGRACEAAEAQRVAALVRCLATELVGQEASNRMRVLYGGSVKAANSSDYLVLPDVDGALVGGASLSAEAFSDIVKSAMQTTGSVTTN